MSKGGKKSSSKAPAPPKPQNEYFYDDDMLRSSRVYDPAQNGYVTKSYKTGAEKAIESQGSQFIADLIPQAQKAFNMTPEGIAEYRNAFAAPQQRALTESYNKALGGATSAANAQGMQNSVGFNRYLANELERNKAQGMADIEANAKLMEYQLPSMALQPYMDAFNLYNAGVSGEQARTMNQLQPAFTGSQAASNFALQNYNNQLAYHQMRNQPSSGGGFFSKLLSGGF